MVVLLPVMKTLFHHKRIRYVSSASIPLAIPGPGSYPNPANTG